MKRIKNILILPFVIFLSALETCGQNIYINPQPGMDSLSLSKPGIFFVPKTTNATNDFLNNGIQFNSIRLITIENVLNTYGVNSVNDAMAVLNAIKPDMEYVSQRCQTLILPIMKMPLWLSSSADTSHIPGAGDPHWSMYHAFPPADYNLWGVLMDSIVDKFNNQWGIDVYWEIWNEPDIWYWQGTPDQYFTFFKNTYDAIKANHPSAKVGGPVVGNFKASFYQNLPDGWLSNSQLDQTIIAQMIDSCVTWNTPLDFIS